MLYKNVLIRSLNEFSCLYIAFSFFEFKCEAMFSIFVNVFSELCLAIFACVGFYCEGAIFPYFCWVWVFCFAFWAFGH